MPIRHFTSLYIFFLLLYASSSLAQGDSLTRRLYHLQTENKLEDWIYEQLDQANEHSNQAIQIISKAEKNIWRKSKSPAEHYARLNMISTLGYYQLLDGNILSSISAYENALQFYRKYQVLDYDIIAYVLKPLSNNYTRLGDYERALFLQEQSLALSQEPNDKASIWANMAITYRSMGRLKDAFHAVDKGLKLASKPFVTTMLRNIHADILYDDGRFGEAQLVIENSLRQQKTVNNETAYWLMSAYTTAANIYYATQQFGKAGRTYLQALHLLNKYYPQVRVRERANLFLKIGATHLAQSQISQCINAVNKALLVLGVMDNKYHIDTKKIYGDNKLMEAFMLLSKCNVKLNFIDKALFYNDLALKVANRIRSEFTEDYTKERLQQTIKDMAEDAIDLNFQLYQHSKKIKHLNQIFILAERSKGRTLLDQIRRNQQLLNSKRMVQDSLFLKKQRLERQITFLEKEAIEKSGKNLDKAIEALKFDLAVVSKNIGRKFGGLLQPESSNVDLKLLPNGRFLEYFLGSRSIYVIDIYQNRVNKVIKIKDAQRAISELKTFVKTYFHQGPNAMLNDPKAFFEASNGIYKLMVAPLQLKNGENLTIIPDGALGYLSFDGLIAASTYTENIAKWPFLIKSHQISYAFSVSTLQQKFNFSRKSGFVALFSTHRKSGKSTLSAIQKEADLISAQLDGDFIFDDDVNAASFNKYFGECGILHIGTHAYLSGSKNEPTLDFGKERLYLFELANKKNAPSLVVLSACQTANGILADGEGVISLARGFNAVGAGASIASLWNVNDDAAAVITSNFYRYLKRSKNPSEALHQAKLSWFNANHPSNAMLLPYYWDSMVYIGKTQKLNLEDHQRWLNFIKGLLVLTFCLTAVYGVSKFAIASLGRLRSF